MSKIAWTILLLVHAIALTGRVGAQDAASREEMRSLDGQVQEIKSDVLAIARDLSLLEEQLLYPSNSQLAVFVSIAAGESFRLDAVQLEIDGELATHYIYSFKELEALQNGGVQRVYTGNVATGSHDLTVTVDGKLGNGNSVSGSETFTFSKGIDPELLGLTLSAGGGGVTIELGNW